MSPEVVRLLLKRRPFVPFRIVLPADTTCEDSNIRVERLESVKFVGDDTLEILDSDGESTSLIDLRLIVRIETSGRL